jgi:sulfonate transport system permease protein
MSDMTDATSSPLDFAAATDGSQQRLGNGPPELAGLGWALPFALLAVWQEASSLGWIGETFLPSPLAVAKAAWRLTLSGELPMNACVSFLRAVAGLVVGGSIGLTLGLANGLSRLSFGLTDTTLQMVRNVPHLALVPLVIVWFGIEEEAKLFLVALGVFFPIYVNTLHGVRSVDPQLIEMARSYGFSGGHLFCRVILPGTLPSIFVGLRFALGVMWLTLIVAETIAAQSLIGYMAMQAREFMQVDVVVLAVLIYAGLGKFADTTVRQLERRCLSWHPAFQTKQ